MQRILLFLTTVFLPFLTTVAYTHPMSGWEMTSFISSSSFLALCQQGVEPYPRFFFDNEYTTTFNPSLYTHIRAGDVVWVPCRFVSPFYNKVLPCLEVPIVLMVTLGDESFPSETGLTPAQIDTLLAHDKILQIFAQNCDLSTPHPKVTPIPIGLDYHTIAYKGFSGGWGEVGSPLEQEAQLKQIVSQLSPTSERIKRAFVDFQHSDSIRGGDRKRYLHLGEDRTSIFNQLLSTGLIDHAPWQRRSGLWKTKGQYAFSISPHGNGLDCHRTWEDLLLGCIVIVKSSPLDSLYAGLPVVIVQDWSEVTEENLDKWLHQYADALTNPDCHYKLTQRYWQDQIEAVSQKGQK